MKRKDALWVMQMCRDRDARSEVEREAFDTAIEALERERTDEWCTDCKEYDTEKKCCPRFNRVIRGAMKREPSEDLISRTEAIEHLMRLSEDESISPITQTLMVGVSNELKKLPSADRPRGEWVEQEDDYHHYWECSECGMGVGLDDIRNFCPNCGAKMNGERSEE